MVMLVCGSVAPLTTSVMVKEAVTVPLKVKVLPFSRVIVNVIPGSENVPVRPTIIAPPFMPGEGGPTASAPA